MKAVTPTVVLYVAHSVPDTVARGMMPVAEVRELGVAPKRILFVAVP